MDRLRCTTAFLVFLLAACGTSEPPPAAVPAALDTVHRAPANEGGVFASEEAAFAEAKSVEAGGPLLTIDAATPEPEKAELQRLLDAALGVLASADFKADMAGLKTAYSKVWLSEALQFADSAGVHALLSAPPAPNTWVATRVYLEGDESDTRVWVDYDPVTNDARRIMRVGRGQLKMFRSANAVEKSCPINSLSHEISHTLSRKSDEFRYAVTDTGSGATGAGNNPMASYLVGSVAQCTYLRQTGRIAADAYENCIGAFGVRPKFPIPRCTAYEAGEAVKWPKDPSPR